MGVNPHCGVTITGRGMAWNDELVSALKDLWAAGYAGSEIAAQLGITRGAVTGKRHSLGLPPRPPEFRAKAMADNARRTALLRGHKGKADDALAAQKVVENLGRMAAMTALRGSNPKPWKLRRPGECAYPVIGFGEQTMSCCEPILPGRAYCLGHCERLAGRPWPPEEPANDLPVRGD